MCLLAICRSSLGEMSVQVFCPLFDWVVHFSGIELHELLVYFGDCQLFCLLLFPPILRAVLSLAQFPSLCKKLSSSASSHLFTLFLLPLLWEVDHRRPCCDLCRRVPCAGFLEVQLSGCSVQTPHCGAPLVAEHGLQGMGSVVVAQGLSWPTACGVFSDQGSNPSPASAGGFFTTEPPWKPQVLNFL